MTQVKMVTNQDLSHFCGTENYYMDSMLPSFQISREGGGRILLKYTDGIKHLRDNGLNWYVFDAALKIVAMQNAGFLPQDLYSIDYEKKGEEEWVIMRNGDLKSVAEWQYDFTDFPEGLDAGMFYTDGVLFLKREY